MANRSYTTKTIKVLFGSSGNQCAHPECTNPVIMPGTEQSDNAVLAQICHIYAVSDSGPRGMPDLTDDERNGPDNLILLCGFHHPLVDTQYQDYPAELLKRWKRDHEAAFRQGTTEAIRRREHLQQSAFASRLTDEQIGVELRRIRQARHLVGYPTVAKARALAKSIESVELSGGSTSVKARALAWCARILARGEHLSRAKDVLAKSRDLEGCQEAEIAHAFIVAEESKSSVPALGLLAQIGTQASRSAMLRIVSNHKGAGEALGWARRAGLQLSSFDAEGKLNFIINEELSGYWDRAYANVQSLTAEDFEEAPVLNYVAAQAHLAQVVPEKLRTQVLFQLPFDTAGVPLADSQEALLQRKHAIELYERQATSAEGFGAIEATQHSAEMALWLRLRDPDLRDSALDQLREEMHDETLMFRRFPMAVQFGLHVDLEMVERRVNERTALTGKGTHVEAAARLALALTKKSPSAALEYIAAHRSQLAEFLEHPLLLGLEIELLCKSGQIATAKAALAQSSTEDLGEQELERLQRMIAEAEGADPAAERRKIYEKTGELRDLADLVSLLEERQAWQELCPLAEALFDQTRSVRDAFRTTRALISAGQDERCLTFLRSIPDIVARDNELQSLLSWALYREGHFSEATTILSTLRAKRSHINDRALFVNLGIASGQWDLLVAYSTEEWEHREQRTAEELFRAGQIAQAVNGPHARDLIVEATKQAPDDPQILAGAYFHASNAGWESDAATGEWLMRAAEASGEDGPLRSVTVKELLDLKPDWDSRQEEVYTALNAGTTSISSAAFALNQSMTHNCLLRPAANRNESDARRRSLVYAFSGARPSNVQADPKRIALDLTAIFTFSQLGLLPSIVTHFERVLIPDQLLVWLFQERQRVAFHQPSRVKDAHFLRRLLADGTLRVFEPKHQADLSLGREVGTDLASMLTAAAASLSEAYVIRSSPVPRVGSVMEEQADLSSYEDSLCSCHAVVEALRLKGIITVAEKMHALSYLKLREHRWPREPRIRDGATLYLDDLSTTYLNGAGVLGKLKAGGFKAYITKSLDDDNNQLLSYEGFADQQLATIEGIRAVLANALADGRVETIKSADRDSQDTRLLAQLNFLASEKPVDAFVVDDRFVNRFLHMTSGQRQTPILTSLDIVDHMVASGALGVDEGREHRTTLRRSGYIFVPVVESELIHYLMQAPLDSGMLIETAELRAIREAAQRLLLARLLQLPHEAAWLNQYMLCLIRAVRIIWESEADPQVAAARCEWPLTQLDIRGWAPIVEPSAARQFAVTAYAGLLHALSFAPVTSLADKTSPYHQWIDERLLGNIRETEPEIFNAVVALATAMLMDALDKVSQDGA